MSTTSSNIEQLQALVSLIKEVKPGLANTEINAHDTLIDILGLDSLDILQLSRRVNRKIGTFDIDGWMSGSGTVQSILDQINSADTTVA